MSTTGKSNQFPDVDQQAIVTPESVVLGQDPLLHLEEEWQGPAPGDWRSLGHPDELVIAGIPQRCPACSARRDWLLICWQGRVSIRCRCAHQWAEPEITCARFNELSAARPRPVRYANVEELLRARGFDGSLGGTYLS
jgi:hypothetical protein